MRELFAAIVFCLTVLIAARPARSVGGGDLVFRPDPNVRPVLFSHEGHVNGHDIKCSGCHYRIFQMAKGSYKMDMEKITKGEFCGACHDGRKAFGVKDRKNCKRCHVP